jgi:hypothetical protein
MKSVVTPTVLMAALASSETNGGTWKSVTGSKVWRVRHGRVTEVSSVLDHSVEERQG